MKSLLLFIPLFLFLIKSQAQSVNDVPIKDIDVEYMQIVGTSKLFSTKVTIQIDFGQETKFFSTTTNVVKDESGKRVSFNSMMDALNFMSKHGYDFVTAYAITIQNQNVYHFLLKKRTE
jgi:hypothetical protein